MSLMHDVCELLTTRQAAELVGRSPDSIKRTLNRGGTLPGIRVEGFWRVRRDDLLAWDKTAPRHPPTKKVLAYERAADILTDYGSATPVEVSKLLGVHLGNARKYLAILAAEGRAHRHEDGTWFPGATPCDLEAAS